MAEFPEAVREAVSEAKVKFLDSIFVTIITFFASIFVTIIIFASPNIYQG